MDVIHIPAAEAERDFAGTLARVRAGAEVVIDYPSAPGVVLRADGDPHVRLLSESLRLAREHGSTAVPDADFARDVEAGIAAHREPLSCPGWE